MASNPMIKKCISCESTRNVRYQGPRCVNCYRREINPATVEKIKVYNKTYRKTSISRYNKGKSEAKSRKINWNLTKEEYFLLNAKPCFYCGGPLPECGVGLDRISPDKNIGYTKDNVLPCCGICNSIRGDKLTVAETIVAINSIKEQRLNVLLQFMENNYDIDTRTIFIFGDINEELSKQVQKGLSILEGINEHAEITIKIMSDGGNWSDGLAIYDRINMSPCPIKMIGTGMVASTATAIFQAGDIREITEHCLFMIHDGFDSFEGETKSFEAWGEAAKKNRKVLYEIYSKASGKPTNIWQTLCAKDTVLWPKDIIRFGLADRILNEETESE